MVKNLPAMQEIGNGNPLQCACLENLGSPCLPWTEESGGLWFLGSRRVGTWLK